MLRGPNSSELETDLAKVEDRLRRMDRDAILSPAERELEKLYFMHWQKRLRFLLAKGDSRYNESVQQADPMPPSLNQVGASDESWKVITPAALLRAVMKIRKDFEQQCDAQRDYFEKRCFEDLHHLGFGKTEPAVFKNYFYACIARIQEIVKTVFDRFLAISLNQNGLIGMAPVEWASLQVVDLIEREDRLVEMWIKSVCDKQNHIIPTSDDEFVQKVLFRTDWRAPNWLYMQPNGNALYVPSTAWGRMTESDTRNCLKYLRESRWILLLQSTLEQFVGAASETLARRRTSSDAEVRAVAQVSQNDRETEGSRQASARTQSTHVHPEQSAQDTSALGPKRQDLSRYLDSARLTQRQYECVSLLLEYGLRKSHIARRLGIHRKTVDEFIAAAEKKLEASKAKLMSEKNRAKIKPDGFRCP